MEVCVLSAEFILLNKEADKLADPLDRHYMTLHDPYLTLRRMPYLRRVSEAMEQLGWGPYEARNLLLVST